MVKLSKAEHEARILEVITEKNLKFISDIEAYYGGIDRRGFYKLGLQHSEPISKALEKNKIISRNKQLIHWEKSDNPTLQIALFRLTCTDEQRKAISTNYNENLNTMLDKDGNSYNPTIKVVLSDSDGIK